MQASELAAGLRCIALSGFLDAAAVARMETDFQGLLPVAGHVVVDLAEVAYCGSLGIRMLLTAARLVKQRGSSLVLAAAQPEVGKMLETMGIVTIIPLAATVEEARRLLPG
jgi:anti-anti-sigma factor